MSASALFWDIAPYVTIAILVVGTWWRYRYDKFGWTTRSSQLYESRLLRIGSPLFHFGILVVIIGHVIGLLIPESWTSAVGLSEQGYHLQAVALGSIAGIATLGGAAILVYRRRTKGPGRYRSQYSHFASSFLRPADAREIRDTHCNRRRIR